jgi:hypothetical protein
MEQKKPRGYTDLFWLILVLLLVFIIIKKENKETMQKEYHLIGCNDYRCILRVDKQYFVVNKKEFYGDKTDNAQ